MTRSGADIYEHMFRPYTEDGEGSLILALGNTRMGKTWATRIIVKELLSRKHVDMVLTVDEKDPEKPQYVGTYRANVGDLLRNPLGPDEDSKHIVFRGVALRSNLSDVVDHGAVAKLVWDLKRTKPKLRILLNVDELTDATNGSQDWLDDNNAQIYRKGMGVRISTTATMQMPQVAPREVFGLSQTIMIFQTDAREIFYYLKYRLVNPDVVEKIERLGKGEFLLYVRGKGLQPDVYKF